MWRNIKKGQHTDRVESAAIGWNLVGCIRQRTTVFRYSTLCRRWHPLASTPVQDVPRYGTRCPSVRRGGAPSTELRRHRATRVALDFRFYFPPTQGGSFTLRLFFGAHPGTSRSGGGGEPRYSAYRRKVMSTWGRLRGEYHGRPRGRLG